MGWPELVSGVHQASLATFGESVTLRLAGQPEVVVRGVFTSRYHVAEVGQEAGVSSSTPAVGLLEADLPAEVSPTDEVDVRGTTYVVHEIQPDGEGWTILLLHRK